MQATVLEHELEPVGQRLFATTRWGLVRAAGTADSEFSQDALQSLCQAYWYPIYVYVRRKGHGPDDAKDLTQEFFAQVIAKQHLRLADHNKGKFRSFLLAMLDHFLAREWSRAHRQKRGGQFQFVSLEHESAEERYQFESVDDDTPEKQFQRQWALAVLQRAMNALAGECHAADKGEFFDRVKHLLGGERDAANYDGIAPHLSMSGSALRVAVHRLRHRYSELLRAEIAKTVESQCEVEEEVRCLIRALAE